MSGAVQSVLLYAAINSLLRDITPHQHHSHREHSTAHIPTFSFLAPVALPNDEVVVGVTCEQSTLALRTSERQVCMRRRSGLDVTDLRHEVVELLLGVGVFLRHLLVLLLPRVAVRFEGLHFALVVAGFDVGLA